MKFNKLLDDVQTYEAGKPIELVVREYGVDSKDIVKLASNENPYGTSPLVKKRLDEVTKNASIYPDDSMLSLSLSLSLINNTNRNLI